MINHFCKTPLWEAAPTLAAVAQGKRPADAVIRGCTLVNVCTHELQGPIDVALSCGRIALVGDGAPCIGPETEVRHCAFIRGNAIVGAGAVVGNSTELKNVILFDRVQVPHYNYVGDSVLGFKSHMGAGSITSNVKSDKTLVTVAAEGGRLETGLKKFGAMLGDEVEVGCGSVLNPGTVIGTHSQVYPLSAVRGFVPAGSIYKKQGEVVEKR